VQNSCLQCVLSFMCDLVIIVLGLYFECIPTLCGTILSQNTQLYTNSTNGLSGYYLNGNISDSSEFFLDHSALYLTFGDIFIFRNIYSF